MENSFSYLEKLVNLGQINSLLGIKFVNIAAVSIHKVQAEPHDLRHGSSVRLKRADRSASRFQAGCTYFEQHVLLAGCQVHLVLIVVDAQVDNVGQQLLVAVYHFQLLLQGLAGMNEKLIEIHLTTQ